MDNSQDYFRTNGGFVNEIDSSAFENTPYLLKNKNLSVILFYADWCMHCKAAIGLWKEFAAKASGMCKVMAFNCANPNNVDHCDKIKRSMPGLIPSFPTIIFFKNGQPIESITQEQRNMKDLMDIAMRLVKN